MTKTLRFLLLACLMVVCGNASAAETTVTWEANSENTFTGNKTFMVDNNVKLTWDMANGDNKPKNDGTKVTFYNANYLTIAGATDDVKITKVAITFSSGSTALITVPENQGTYANSTWTGEQNSVTFRAARQTGSRYISAVEVSYTGGTTDPVVTAPVLNITNANLADTYDMDANGVFVVYYENKGNADAENAKLTLYVDGVENASKEIGTLGIGSSDQNFWNAKYDVANLAAGEHQVKLAFTADGADPVYVEKTVTFTKKAPEPTFEISVNDLEVDYGTDYISMRLSVKNTSTIDANNYELFIMHGIDQLLYTVNSFPAGQTKNFAPSFTNPFKEAPGTYDLYVKVGNSIQQFKLTVKPAPVVEKKDLAITEVLGTLDLANTSNNVRITVQNNGTVDITDAVVTLKAGETKLGEATVSAKAGQSGFCFVAVASEGLTAGDLTVTATVAVEGDETPADNTVEATLTVNAIPAAEATFTVTAENVTVAFGATSFDIVSTVKNTSETVAAENVEVKLFNNTVVDTKTIATLAAGAEETVTFRLTGDAILEGGKTATYYVQAPKTQAEVTVTFEKEAEAENIDMALTQIQGVTEINLLQDNNIVIWYKNNGNVAVENATIEVKLNGTPVATLPISNVAVEAQNHVDYVLPTTGLVAGEKANVELNLFVNNDANLNDNSLRKEYNIVSGEAEPQAEIAINPINGWNVEAGEQTVNVSVTLFNNGEVDAKDVKVELYKSYGDNLCEPQIVNVSCKEGENFQMLTFTFNYTFETGKSYEFTAYTGYTDADNSNQMQKFVLTCATPVATVTIARIADVKATTEEEVKVAATLKNNSDVDAKEVKVGIYALENNEYTLVGVQQIVEVEANGQTSVEFNLGKLAVGSYTYSVQVSSVDGTASTANIPVDITVSEPVEQNVEVALTAIQGISSIDLAEGANNTISVWAENKGNVDATATINVTLNGTALEAQTVELKAGKSGYAEFALPTESLTAGEKAIVEATIAVEGNTSEAVKLTREYDIVNSSVATEPVFEISAADVEVEFGAEKFDVVATVKNTNGMTAANVPVTLFYNGVIETKTVQVEANGEAVVTFADVANPFAKAGVYTMYVQAPKAQAEVKITVKSEPVAETIEVALTAIQGISNIDLAEGAVNTISVWAENAGNVDATATINVSLNGTALDAQTVEVKVGKNGYATFTLPTEGLTAGEKATVEATVAVEGNTSEVVKLTREYDVVNSAVATEPVFEISAADVVVEFGAEKFNVVAIVKNTSNIVAENVEVSLFNNGVIATQTIATLAVGAEETVTFADVVNPFTKAGVYTMFVQAPKAQAEVKITVKPEAVEEKIDLAVTSISGTLSLETETNYISVFVENKGNVDVEGASVSIGYTVGNDAVGKVQTLSVKAGKTAFATFEVPAADLTPGEFTIFATVGVYNDDMESIDTDETNNEISKTYTIAAPAAALSFTVEEVTALKDATSFDVKVNVKNTGKGDAENVAVKVYDENSTLLGEATIATIAAGADETAVVTINKTYTEVRTYRNQLQIYVAGVEDVKWASVTVTDDPIVVGIAAIKAVYGENVQIFNLAGKKVGEVRKGGLYIVNGHKVVIK